MEDIFEDNAVSEDSTISARAGAWKDVLPRLMERGGTVVVPTAVVVAWPAGESAEGLGLEWPYCEMGEIPAIEVQRLNSRYYAIRLGD